MHGILLGVLKKLMSLWFDSTNYQKPYFIGHKLKDIDKSLKSIQPPYLIHRTPRKIENNVNHWKASEFRSWLLFYSLPCLSGILPDTYLHHYACLVEGIFILLGEEILNGQLERAEKLLSVFYEVFGELYGEAALSINLHNAGHLTALVKRWGPLWVYSCFAFESFNGELTRAVHGKGNICGEIFWAVQREKILTDSVKELPQSAVKDYLNSMLQSSTSTTSYEIGYQCSVVKPLMKVENNFLNASVKDQVKELLNLPDYDFSDILKEKKILRNDYVFYSTSCSRVKNRNSYTIKLEREFQNVNYVSVDYYLFHQDSKKVFAVCCGMNDMGSIIERRLPHIRKIELPVMRGGLVIPVELFKEPVIFMKLPGVQYVAEFPNFIERD